MEIRSLKAADVAPAFALATQVFVERGTLHHVVLNRLGHQKIGEIAFADFKFQDRHPFRAVTEPPSIILAQGDL